MNGRGPSLRELKKLVRETFERSSEAMQQAVTVKAHGLLLKGIAFELFDLNAIQTAERRQRANGRPAPPKKPPCVLSKREMEVLELLVDGKSSREVATMLGISFKTATCHRANIMSKLEVHETASLVRQAIRLGLVEP